MDNIRSESPGDGKGFQGEQDIESDLVPRRAHLVVGSPGYGYGSLDTEAIYVIALVVGDDGHAVAQPLQAPRLFEDADMAAIVPEEGGWGNHQDVIRSPGHARRRSRNRWSEAIGGSGLQRCGKLQGISSHTRSEKQAAQAGATPCLIQSIG